MKKMNKKGFTLAELLIVVAIIAVLVAIAIPVFSAQLEKSRDATTLANLRSAYATATTVMLGDDATGIANVTYNSDAGTVVVGNVAWEDTDGTLADSGDLPFALTNTHSGGKAKVNVTFTFADTGAVTAAVS